MTTSRLCRWPLLASLVLTAGCGGSNSKLVEVQGTVKLKGQPLKNVRVDFFPDAAKGNQALPASGQTDEQGHFTLTCSNGRPGAAPGVYRVTVVDPAVAAADDDIELINPGAKAKRSPARRSPNPPIPPTYLSSSTTRLVVEVREGKPVELNLGP